MTSFASLAFLLVFACIISLIIYIIRLPLVFGYIIVGILIGPYFLNLISNSDSLELFAKIGIVSLLFIVGLNLNPNTIKEEAKESLILGLSQIAFTALSGFLLFYFIFNFPILPSILIASGLTLSSTIVVLKIISDKGDIDKLYSKMSLGVLLIQDFFATILLLILSIMHTASIGEIKTSIIVASFSLKVLILILIYFILSKWILPKISKLFAKSQELLLLFSAAFSFSYAYLFYVLGFSLEIGALFAGIILSASNFSKEIASRFRPIRDFFIIIFFIILGLEAEFINLIGAGWIIAILSIFVIIANPLILFIIMNLLGHRTRTSFYTSLTMGQVSEFSLVILSIARVYGYIDSRSFSIVLIVMLISICVTSYLILYSEKIYKHFRPILHFLEIRKNNKKIIDKDSEIFDFIVFGYDRVGKRFLDLAKEEKFNYAIIDINPKNIEKAQNDGGIAFFGDAGDIIFLEENNILKSKMIVSTIPDFNINMNLIGFYKKNKKDKNKIIIVVAHKEDEAKALYKEGADYVIMPYHIGAEEAAYYISKFSFDKNKFIKEKNKHIKKLSKN